MTWVGLMAADLEYRMPVRMTKDRVDGSEFSTGMDLFDENMMTMMMKATRLAMTESAWAEKPPSRTRRFITNIRVYRTPIEGEYRVVSSVLLVRNRYDEPNFELVSARRADVLREAEESFEIAQRTIYADQATIGTQNLAIFL
jgi:3-phenylpropionate/cinnamic acid dioxygenase small subunit